MSTSASSSVSESEKNTRLRLIVAIMFTIIVAGSGLFIALPVSAQLYGGAPYGVSNTNYYPSNYSRNTYSDIRPYDPAIPTGSLSTSPHDAAPGTSIIVAGSAFPRNSLLTIYFGNVTAARVVSDSNGNFQTVVRLPNLPVGLVTVTADGADPYNPPTFYVNAPVAPRGNVYPSYTTVPQTASAVVPTSNWGTTVSAPRPARTDQTIASLQAQIALMQRQLADLISQLNTAMRGY